MIDKQEDSILHNVNLIVVIPTDYSIIIPAYNEAALLGKAQHRYKLCIIPLLYYTYA